MNILNNKFLFFLLITLKMFSQNSEYSFIYEISHPGTASYHYYSSTEYKDSNDNFLINIIDEKGNPVDQILKFEIFTEKDTINLLSKAGKINAKLPLTSFKFKFDNLGFTPTSGIIGVENTLDKKIELTIVVGNLNNHNIILRSKRKLNYNEIEGITKDIMSDKKPKLVKNKTCDWNWRY